MLGDGVWEGLRVHRGVVVFAAQHLERLWEGAKALDMDLGLSQRQLLHMVYQTLEANGMGSATGVHIRLMATRGLKSTPYQDPRVTVGRPTIVVLPEWKEQPGEGAGGPREKGLRLFTVHVRRGAPDVQDPALNSHSKINCITACIQAAKAGADEALMLDPSGFVATCNSTNFIIVRRGEVWAPRGGHMMRGITRDLVLALAAEEGLSVRELDFSLSQVYGADEAMVTGTMAGVLPVVEVDGRVIGAGRRGPVTARLQALYGALLDTEAAAGRDAALDDEARGAA
ncbi:MAG: branched chain amino acid aminotransferase [Monoraphidium minutum]|nr:MAG: branched chain amino acid aminotransferase [Monoraphidium minutum]